MSVLDNPSERCKHSPGVRNRCNRLEGSHVYQSRKRNVRKRLQSQPKEIHFCNTIEPTVCRLLIAILRFCRNKETNILKLQLTESYRKAIIFSEKFFHFEPLVITKNMLKAVRATVALYLNKFAIYQNHFFKFNFLQKQHTSSESCVQLTSPSFSLKKSYTVSMKITCTASNIGYL